MQIWDLPPKAKIYEALSAISDGRVRILTKGKAEVISSSRTKTYSVFWTEGLNAISSNDNASYWRGYMGYPIIAVLMQLGKVHFDHRVADILRGIKWKAVNEKFRNNYDEAVAMVLGSIEKKGFSPDVIQNEVDRIMRDLHDLRLVKLPHSLELPKDSIKK